MIDVVSIALAIEAAIKTSPVFKTVTCDGYLDIKASQMPAAMIDIEETPEIESSSDGTITGASHKIGVVILVAANGKPYSSYKAEAVAAVKAAIEKIGTVTPVRPFVRSINWNELPVGSVLTSGAVINLEATE